MTQVDIRAKRLQLVRAQRKAMLALQEAEDGLEMLQADCPHSEHQPMPEGEGDGWICPDCGFSPPVFE